MQGYVFFIDGLNRYEHVVAASEREAHKTVWERLPDFEKDRVACLDCVEVIEAAPPAEETVARFREIAENMAGPLVCENGMRWHPTEIFGLLALLEKAK